MKRKSEYNEELLIPPIGKLCHKDKKNINQQIRSPELNANQAIDLQCTNLRQYI